MPETGALRRLLPTLIVTMVLSYGAYLFLVGAKPVEIPFGDETQIALGESLYADHCAACHGADREGESGWQTPDQDGYYPAPPLDQNGHAWHHPDTLLFDIVKLGPEAVVGGGYRSRMPGLGDTLSDNEILAILAYVKASWPLLIAEAHNWVNGKPSGNPVRPEDLEACGLSIGLQEADRPGS